MFVLLEKGDVLWPVGNEEVLLKREAVEKQKSLSSGVIGLAVRAWMSSFDPQFIPTANKVQGIASAPVTNSPLSR